jgi:hypothetical protein
VYRCEYKGPATLWRLPSLESTEEIRRSAPTTVRTLTRFQWPPLPRLLARQNVTTTVLSALQLISRTGIRHVEAVIG